MPSPFAVKFPKGYRLVAKPLLFSFKKTILELVSGVGLVLGLSKISVKPDDEATFKPFLIVSLSSKPGSPKLTLLSNQPRETCRFSNLISLASLGASILDAIF